MNFFDGFASVFDISGRKLLANSGYNTTFESGFFHDKVSLFGDWKKIGGDIRKAVGVFENERR